MSALPDPLRAHALIIGTSLYDDHRYMALPAARASAIQFEKLIIQRDIWGLPKENVQSLTGRVTVRQAAQAIERTAAIPDLGALLVYICGHGQRWTEDDVPDKKLHFAFSDSDRSWPFTHLPFRAVRTMLREVAQTADTLLIIDCCYANGAFLAGEGHGEPLEVPRVCTMVPTKWPVRASASWPGTDYTAFSGALIDIIENGILGPEKYLTPDSIFKVLRNRLTERVGLEPDMRGNGAQIFLCRNRRYTPAPDQSSYPELLKELDKPSAVDAALYVMAVAESDAAELPEDAKRLIAEFCQKRRVTETVKLTEVLRSAELGGYADHAIERVYMCRSGLEVAQFCHLLHRQADLGVGSVLKVLATRPATVLADLRAELRTRTCDECSAIEGQINDQILEIWPLGRLDELLVALH